MTFSTCILFLCFQPSSAQLSFYSTFASLGYTVWVIVDDPTWQFSPVPGLVTYQFSDHSAIASGFLGTNPAIRKPLLVSAWDKALYAIHHSSIPHIHYWLIEDDVFLASPQALLQIDRLHPSADLLTASSTVISEASPWMMFHNGWPWVRHVPRHLFPLPWAYGMVCAVRVSARLATEAALLVQRNSARLDRRNRRRRAFASVLAWLRVPQAWIERFTCPSYLFIEYLFHTLALHLKLEVITPDQLTTILWRQDWAVEDMLPTHLYHPVKTIADHPYLRNLLAKERP